MTAGRPRRGGDGAVCSRGASAVAGLPSCCCLLLSSKRCSASRSNDFSSATTIELSPPSCRIARVLALAAAVPLTGPGAVPMSTTSARAVLRMWRVRRPCDRPRGLVPVALPVVLLVVAPSAAASSARARPRGDDGTALGAVAGASSPSHGVAEHAGGVPTCAAGVKARAGGVRGGRRDGVMPRPTDAEVARRTGRRWGGDAERGERLRGGEGCGDPSSPLTSLADRVAETGCSCVRESRHHWHHGGAAKRGGGYDTWPKQVSRDQEREGVPAQA